MPRPEKACGLLEVDFSSSAQKSAVANGVMTPWPLSVEVDNVALVPLPYYHRGSPATPIRPIRAHNIDFSLTWSLLAGISPPLAILVYDCVVIISSTAYSHTTLSTWDVNEVTNVNELPLGVTVRKRT